MKEIFEQISRLKGYNEKVFYGDVFGDNGTYKREFMIILNELTECEKKEFYDGYPPEYGVYFDSELKKNEPYDPEDILSAEKVIQEIIADNELGVEKLKIQRQENKKRILEYRNLLKAGKEYGISDQQLEIQMPSMQKPYSKNAEIVDLPKEYAHILKTPNILDCINTRKSRRKFNEDELSLTELAYLLWSTQGVRKLKENKYNLRTVPSGGARQPFETYLTVNHVTGLKPGVYRYLALEHKLMKICEDHDLKDKMTDYANGQKFVGHCAVCFIWTAIPYRMEWRYTLQAKKDILIEAGHVCQNLYLACESIGAGTCGIAAYDQEQVDALIGADGVDEMTVYLAPVGRYDQS